VTRLEKAREALRQLEEAEATMIARETSNVLRLFAAKRRQVETELEDASK
jgi:hypothetical protein